MKESNLLKKTEDSKVFYFSQEKTPVRVNIIDGNPWFLARDVCKELGISNNSDAISRLDDDQRMDGVGITDTMGRKQSATFVSESGLYNLIFSSRKPIAKIFRRWVTSEVLPSIRKKGYYSIHRNNSDFLDMRDFPYNSVLIFNYPVRVIEINNEKWFHLNDLHYSMKSKTDNSQAAKRLNAKQILAKKILIFGMPQPSWFVNELGLKLLITASSKLKQHAKDQLLELPFKNTTVW